MASLGSATIYVHADMGDTVKKFDDLLERVAKLRKFSFWFILKMRLLGVHKRRTMISIQELIAKDHEYRL
jgi:hypothetical protein